MVKKFDAIEIYEIAESGNTASKSKETLNRSRTKDSENIFLKKNLGTLINTHDQLKKYAS